VEHLGGSTWVAELDGLLASAGVVAAALPEMPSRATTAVPEPLLHSLAAAPVGVNVARQAKDAAARMCVRWSYVNVAPAPFRIEAPLCCGLASCVSLEVVVFEAMYEVVFEVVFEGVG
jgi:hypothetical protein